MDKFMDSPWFLRFTALFLAIMLFLSVKAEDQANRNTANDVFALLQDVPGDECHLILENWQAAVNDETITAVANGQTFRKIVTDGQGTTAKRVIQDEIVVMTPALQAWISELRTKARYQVLGCVGRIATTLERLDQGLDDLDLLCQARRQQAKNGKKKAQRPPAKKDGKAKNEATAAQAAKEAQ